MTSPQKGKEGSKKNLFEIIKALLRGQGNGGVKEFKKLGWLFYGYPHTSFSQKVVYVVSILYFKDKFADCYYLQLLPIFGYDL